MNWLTTMDWAGGGWIVPAIHVYAAVVLALVVSVYLLHQSRLQELARRVEAIVALIEGRSPHKVKVRLQQLSGMILHLEHTVERRSDVDIPSILEFVRREERQRDVSVARNLVNIVETMIELFPMLGIFGTVWGFSGVSQQDFSSQRLLFLFGVATGTTLWALFYVIVFRITYSAFVQSKVLQLEEYDEKFQEFLVLLDRRNSAEVDSGAAAAPLVEPWSTTP